MHPSVKWITATTHLMHPSPAGDVKVQVRCEQPSPAPYALCLQTGPCACLQPPTATPNSSIHQSRRNSKPASAPVDKTDRQVAPTRTASGTPQNTSLSHQNCQPLSQWLLDGPAAQLQSAPNKRLVRLLFVSSLCAACSTPQALTPFLSCCRASSTNASAPNCFGLFGAAGRSRHKPI